MDEYDVEKIVHNVMDSSESWTPQAKMSFIIGEIDNIKSDMRMFLDNCKFDLTAILNESTRLCAENKDLVEEMILCKTEIENETMTEIQKSIKSRDQIGKELDRVTFAMNIVGDIIQCGRFVQTFDDARESQSYSRAIKSVCDLLMYIDHPADGFKDLDIYVNIKITAQLILDSLLHDLNQEWSRMVSYTISTKNHKSVITLNITLDDSNTTFDVINALDKGQKLTEKVAEFAEFLKQEVFKAILHNDCKVYTESDELVTITVSPRKLNYRPLYSDTISNMRLVFHFLNTKFSLKFDDDRTIMKIIGQLICAEYCEMMINECFIHTIPNNINDFETYSKIQCEIREFQYFLIIIKFFPDKGLSLLNYMDNIDVLFANCSSQHYLKTARSIMLKDLSVTMSIGVEKIPKTTVESVNDSIEIDVAEALDIFQKTIPNSLFYFPRCLISKTAQELLDLVYTIMEQAVQCSDIVCKKLYCTVRFIFELYDAVVPYYHEKYLQTIPQYVALFHNNCMYLAHNLQTLGDKWLSLMEGRKLDYAIGFVDLVQKLRELGYTHLTMHMQQQRKQILDNVRSSDLNCIVVKDVLGENAEIGVRQCLRQLQLLKNVWIGVFPPNVFTKLMSTLVNMFIEELIHRVCTAEDISMDIASQLTDIYTLVVKKSPKFFIATSDVEKYVKSWEKLQVLIFVLGGSLKDIENHWSDGTGPLAVHFDVEEIRSLIKALFQNTQFRANLLSKIK